MVLNIAAYQFVEIEAPESFVSRVREALEGLDLRGTILIAGEGINLFLAGAPADVEAFLEWLRADPRFAHIVCKRSFSETQPFARLKVKLKSEIISFRQDNASPLARRAASVQPADLARWIAQGRDDEGKRLVLLDTRNRQEVTYGTFAGALHFPIDKFTDLPAAVAGVRHALEDATVVSFCTGGIRCEKAALWMQAEGMANVLQLDGGILGYFEKVGGFGYEGRCFVFDERVALDSDLKPMPGQFAV
ncbi:MAG: sulfurtransferase [Dokdonella sp.]|nr:MAG: sulfurtransferase [Gammaproteobacteria bacterium]TXI78012.1 MAG: sulfurtransferase [Dokdonella sp.]